MKNTHFIARLPAAIFPIALLLSSLARAEEERAPPPPPEWDFVEFEVKGWGAPVTSWRISLYGASFTETRRDPGDATGAYTLIFREIEEAVALYVELEPILLRLPSPAPDSQDCANFMPDMAYGTIRLTRGATTTEIAWNSGCLDEDYAAFMEVLRQADELVSQKGRAAPVSREEQRTP